MKSGATETSYVYLSEHYQFPDNVFVSHLPEEIKKSNHPYKILWAHHAYDQPVFVNFDHNTVNHIVSPSQWNKERLIRYHNIPDHKITVIPNGVADIFSYSDKKTKTMIYTSIPYKGLEVLSIVIQKIHQRHPDAKFKIFSSMSLYGPSNDIFLDLYDHLKTFPYVEYSQAVDQEELVPHYQEAAFFIHPNIWEETFCVSMVEAMKSGAYPIITNIGALAEVAGENNASVVPIDGIPTSKGYQVTEDFMNSFADSCCLALDYYDKDQEYYHKVSKIISDQVSEKYNWKNVAEQWKTLISNIQNNQIDTPPMYYCMVSTHNSEEYTDLAIDSFFRNTQFREQDRFFLIDNDGKYQLTQNRDKITIISNHQPKTFAENMNFVMKFAFIDKSDFFGLNNDLFFTENWNKNFGTRKSISVPLCNQKLTGEFGDLKIKSAMNINDFGGKETELNEFIKTIDPQKVNINKEILGFHCFHIPYEVLSKVGFFDENFRHGGEDIDYRLRAYDLGFDMDVNCSSYLLHFYGKSTWRSGEEQQKTLDREQQCYDYFVKKWGKEMSDNLLTKSSIK
jgi:glycosyltransferase involved in cell wall biosynthesis/GT2 family glycosyltransferase